MKSSSASPDRSANSTLAGIGLMLAGIALFSVNDALGKWLVASYSVGELLLVRSAAGLILLAPFIRQAGVDAFTAAPLPGLQVVRVILSTLEVAMFFCAVSYLPLVDTVTFYLAGPIYVTALSVILLGEKVGWRRWAAVLFGFAGVVLALRPSAASFTLPALVALACVNRSLMLAPASVVVPYQYTLIVWAIVLGYIVFGDLPDAFTLSGAAVIITAGLYIFFREQT